jgi:hypothetical protein
MEQVVSRSDLNSDSSDSSSPPPSNLQLSDQQKYEFYYHTAQPDEATRHKNAQTQTEQSDLSFRLFSNLNTTGQEPQSIVTQTITINSPEPENAEPGFILKEQSLDKYLSLPITPGFLAMLKSVAYSGEDVRAQSKKPCPGNQYPWKVTHLPASADKTAKSPRIVEFNGQLCKKRRDRTRAGKKYRLKQREKHAAARALREKQEVAAREKKTFRNREKKVKKRLRDKAKKEGEAATDVVAEET